MSRTDAQGQAGTRAEAGEGEELSRDAAQWFARLHSGEATPHELRAFAAWRAADPANERAYRRFERLWDAAGAMPEARLRALAREAGPSPARSGASRRRFGLGLAAACSLAVATGVVDGSRWFARPASAIELAAGRGERRQAALPDGSVLALNSGTRAVVRFDEARRLVELLDGEAFFDVRRDRARPFWVDAGMGRVAVTGTRFNVRRDAAALQVSVESGSVLVQSGRWWRRAERRLAAGEQVVAHADGTLGDVRAVDVAKLAAWQRGKLVFRDAPLARVVDEMNRYLAWPLRLDAPEVAGHRVSGVFNVDDAHAMIEALPAIAPVRVRRLADGGASIVAR